MKTSAQKKNASSFKNEENFHEDIEEKPATLADKVIIGFYCSFVAGMIAGVLGYFIYSLITALHLNNYFLIIPPIASFSIFYYVFNSCWQFNRQNGFKDIPSTCDCHRNSAFENNHINTNIVRTVTQQTHTGDFYDPSDISSYTHPAGVNYHDRH